MQASPSHIPAILSEQQYQSCRLCPRQCGVNRAAAARSGVIQTSARHPGGTSQPAAAAGYCRCSDRVKVARAALHFWEEPCISGPSPAPDTHQPGTSQPDAGRQDANRAGASQPDANHPGAHQPSTNSSGISQPGTARPSPAPSSPSGGSGAVFFSGCTLGCCFCQNTSISHERFGKEITTGRLADIFLRLQDQGAYNINLVTATQYLPSVVRALELVRGRLRIPVVYNCGGYERPEIVKALADYVDIWLPDLKYRDPAASARYSQAKDYFRYASEAIPQMIAQTGPPVLDPRGIMVSGVIVRHMVLPGMRADSIRLLHWMSENLPRGGYYLSLMSQYTPAGKAAPGISPSPYPELTRRITTYEYESVLNAALDLGLDLGYMQKKSSAKEEYTPPFDLEGV